MFPFVEERSQRSHSGMVVTSPPASRRSSTDGVSSVRLAPPWTPALPLLSTITRAPARPPLLAGAIANDQRRVRLDQLCGAHQVYLAWCRGGQSSGDVVANRGRPTEPSLNDGNNPPIDDARPPAKPLSLLTDSDCQYVREDRLQRQGASDEMSSPAVLSKSRSAKGMPPILDQPYYAYPNCEDLLQEDIGDRLFLSNGEKAVCRHRSAEEVSSLLARDTKQEDTIRWADRRAEKFSLIVQGKAALPAELEARYHAMHDSNAPCAIVQNDSWGLFLGHAFDAMPDRSVKYYLCLTQDHVMVLRLRKKPAGYIASLYDGTMPLVHVRCATADRSGVDRFGIDTFIHPDLMTRYFGEGGNASREVVFKEIASDDSPATGTGEGALRGAVKLFGAAPISPSGVYQLFKRGLPFDLARSALEQTHDSTERLALLTAKDIDGWPGLAAALKYDRPNTVREFGDTLFRECEAGRLQGDDLFALLEGKGPNGEPAILCAIQNNAIPAIQEYGRVLIEARRRGLLSGDQMKRLLSGRWRNFAAVSTAVVRGDATLVKCFCDVIVGAYSALCITADDARALIDEPSGAHNRSALQIANGRGKHEAVTVIDDAARSIV